MRSPSKKRTTGKERELTERIRELEEKLAASIPKVELETVRSNLQLEINDLKTRLSIAEDQAARAELPESAEARLDEDGFEEREADGSSAERRQMESSTEDLPTADSEDEDSDEPEAAESCIEPQITDQSESGYPESRGRKATVSAT